MTPGFIVVHQSASAWGDAELIDRWHKAAGFKRQGAGAHELSHIGYHFVIYNGRLAGSHDRNFVAEMDGHVATGRHENEPGAHCPSMNSRSVSVCLIGHGSDFTLHQLRSLVAKVAELMVRHNIDADRVIGHYETPTQQSIPEDGGRKTCPGLDMDEWRPVFRRAAWALAESLRSEEEARR